MKNVLFLAFILGSLALSGCQQENDAETGVGQSSADLSEAQSAGSPDGTNGTGQGEQLTGEVHTGSGDITEIDGDRVTISHGPVESIGWPAMTMTFQAESPDMLQGLNIGDPVDFQFRKSGERFVVASISRVQQ